MIATLVDLNVAELKRELIERQLNTRGKREELQERLESWLIDNGFDAEEYTFIDPVYRIIMDNKEEFKSAKNELKTLNSVPREAIEEGSLSKAATSYQLEETSRGTENITPAESSTARPIASLVSDETEEMADGSTLVEIKVLLPWSGESGERLTEELGEADGAENLAEINSLVVDMDGPIEEPHRRVDNVANKNNNELRESLANINEFAPVSGEPVPCLIASLESVGEKTEVISEGETLGETPCVEESVEELDLGDSGERFELEAAEFNSVVDVVEIRAADSIAAVRDVNSEVPEAGNAKSMLVDRVCEVLSIDGDVDSATLLNPEFRTKPLGGAAEGHPVVASYETVDLRKSSVAEIRVAPHELLMLLFIMFSNFVGITFGTGGRPATAAPLMYRQRKDCVPKVKMKDEVSQGTVCSGRTDLGRV